MQCSLHWACSNTVILFYVFSLSLLAVASPPSRAIRPLGVKCWRATTSPRPRSRLTSTTLMPDPRAIRKESSFQMLNYQVCHCSETDKGYKIHACCLSSSDKQHAQYTHCACCKKLKKTFLTDDLLV
jgi:hypothetical protein